MNHKELVCLAVSQLKKWRCIPVLSELVSLTSSGEIPDAIGWRAWDSILFECKSSREDFLKDKNKPFRIVPEMGMGDFRFYLTNENVILSEEELPNGWGCYESVCGKVKHKFGTRFTNTQKGPLDGNKRNEITILRSWIRRQYNQLPPEG